MGLDAETNVSPDYKQNANAFTGKIIKVTVEAEPARGQSPSHAETHTHRARRTGGDHAETRGGIGCHPGRARHVTAPLGQIDSTRSPPLAARMDHGYGNLYRAPGGLGKEAAAMRRMLAPLVLTSLFLSGTALAQTAHVMVQPDDMKWVEGPPSLPRGAKFAVIGGSPWRRDRSRCD